MEINTDSGNDITEATIDGALIAGYVVVNVDLKPHVDPLRSDSVLVNGCFEQDPSTGQKIFSVTEVDVVYPAQPHNPAGDYLPKK